MKNKSIIIFLIMLILVGCEINETESKESSSQADETGNKEVNLSYYEYFLYEFFSGDPCSITFNSATDNKIHFSILAGGPYRTDGKSATAEECVGILKGNVVEFDFVDNYNNKGTGTLSFDKDYVIIKTEIFDKNPGAEYSVELDSKLGRFEAVGGGAVIDSTFIFADSDSRYLSEEEITELPQDTLGYARNEIYARHGYNFTNPKYASYFYNQAWYDKFSSPEFPDKPSTYLNDYEIKNIELIKKIEESNSPEETDDSQDINLSYYGNFIYEAFSGDTSTILFGPETEDQISFKIIVGEPYLIEGDVPMAENCVGTLRGDVVEFDFVDNYNNKGTGTLSFEGDHILLKTIVEEADSNAEYSVEAESKLNREECWGSDISMDSTYICSDSNSRYLKEEELLGLSKDDLEYARNEIYARHGYIFTNPKYASYFYQKTWYIHNFSTEFTDNPNKYLNDYEIKNIELIKKIENK